MVELSPMKKSLSHPTPTIYGIPNCDSVKKARVWMEEHAPSYVFHDFKKQGLPEDALDFWLSKVSWEVLVNRKGTTWRKLSPAHQAKVNDAKSARALMLDNPSVIKRPVVVVGETVSVGVNPEAWESVIQ
jgi:Spx/MgsR family transcriptional regulator